MREQGLAYALVCTTILTAGAAVAAGAAGDAANLAGTRSCRMCHSREAASWQEGPHAKAIGTLSGAEAKAVAAKLGVKNPALSGKCLKCHSTAYWWSEEVKTDKVAVEDGVSCESCHGAGKNYKPKAVMESRDASIRNGLVHPATKMCAECHNEQSPAWNPERYTTRDGKKVGFDAEQAWVKIKHPDPRKAGKK